MRTSAAMSAAILAADAAAQAAGEAQTLCIDPRSDALTIFTSHNYAVLLEGKEKPFVEAILTVYPDGRVDLYRPLVPLPKEVSDHVY
jgi:hypothetical protein